MVAVEDCADLGTTTESKCATPDCVGCEGRGMCCECLVHDLVVSLGCVGVLSKDLYGLLEFFKPLAEWLRSSLIFSRTASSLPLPGASGRSLMSLPSFVEALTYPVEDGGRILLGGTLRLAVLRAVTHVFWRSIEGSS